MSLKESLYDWGGANAWLFRQINARHSDAYDRALLVIGELGNYRNFKYYFIATAVVLAFTLLSRRLRGHKPNAAAMRSAAALLITMVMGYALYGLVISGCKLLFQMPSPFVVYYGVQGAMQFVGDYPDPSRYYESFPSSHAATALFLLTAWWPHLPPLARLFGVPLVAFICWSRIAVGMHFPVDVLAGAVLGFLCAMLVRRYVYKMLRARNSMTPDY